MRTLALRRCTPYFPPIRRRVIVLRIGGPVARGAPAARAGAGATPQFENLVRAWDQARFHTPALAPLGGSLSCKDPCGKAPLRGNH